MAAKVVSVVMSVTLFGFALAFALPNSTMTGSFDAVAPFKLETCVKRFTVRSVFGVMRSIVLSKDFKAPNSFKVSGASVGVAIFSVTFANADNWICSTTFHVGLISTDASYETWLRSFLLNPHELHCCCFLLCFRICLARSLSAPMPWSPKAPDWSCAPLPLPNPLPPPGWKRLCWPPNFFCWNPPFEVSTNEKLPSSSLFSKKLNEDVGSCSPPCCCDPPPPPPPPPPPCCCFDCTTPPPPKSLWCCISRSLWYRCSFLLYFPPEVVQSAARPNLSVFKNGE